MKQKLEKFLEFIFRALLLIISFVSFVLAAKLKYWVWYLISVLTFILFIIRKTKPGELNFLQKFYNKLGFKGSSKNDDQNEYSQFKPITNEKGQNKSYLRKYKFLIPQIVNLAFMIFICSFARIDGNAIVAMFMLLILATIFSIHFYKIDFSKEYAEEVLKEKNLPWNKRAGSYQIRAGLEDMSFILYVLIGFFVFGIISSLAKGDYSGAVVLIIFGIIVLLVSSIVKKILKKFFSK